MVEGAAARMVAAAAATMVEVTQVAAIPPEAEAIPAAVIQAAEDMVASSSIPILIGLTRHILTLTRIRMNRIRRQTDHRPTRRIMHPATCPHGRFGIIAISRTAITRT